MRRLNAFLKNIALFLLSAGLVLFLIEMVLRVTELVPVHRLEYVSPEQWNAIPGPLHAGQRLTDRFTRGLPYGISVNAIGFRGPEVSPEKRTGSVRILCVGGSHTFGVFVDDRETWPAQLEAALGESLPDHRVEALNAGVIGYTIVDALAFLEENGLELEPDIVVIEITPDALADLGRPIPAREELRRSIERNAASPLGRARLSLRQTAVYNALSVIGGLRGGAAASDDVSRIGHEPAPHDLLETYRISVARIASFLRGSQVALVLMVFPSWDEIRRDDAGEVRARLSDIADEIGVPVVDPLPAFRRFDPTGRKYFLMPKDRHPSPRGYRRAAVELADRLQPMILRFHADTGRGVVRPAEAQ